MTRVKVLKKKSDGYETYRYAFLYLRDLILRLLIEAPVISGTKKDLR